MSGHSKWAGIKHKKAIIDAKKGKVFSKIIREIVVACKEGGSDPDKNAKLRLIISRAKQCNMPSDNIKKAIERSSKAAESYETVCYEGYGPGGVAVLLTAQTDNRNRTTQEVRKIFSHYGGNLGEVGCVGWMFHRKGYFPVSKVTDEGRLMEIAIPAGADDIKETDDGFEITSTPENFEKVLNALKEAGIESLGAGVMNIPTSLVKLEEKHAFTMLKLMNELENQDDVIETSANFDIPENIMEKFAADSG